MGYDQFNLNAHIQKHEQLSHVVEQDQQQEANDCGWDRVQEGLNRDEQSQSPLAVAKCPQHGKLVSALLDISHHDRVDKDAID